MMVADKGGRLSSTAVDVARAAAMAARGDTRPPVDAAARGDTRPPADGFLSSAFVSFVFFVAKTVTKAKSNL